MELSLTWSGTSGASREALYGGSKEGWGKCSPVLSIAYLAIRSNATSIIPCIYRDGRMQKKKYKNTVFKNSRTQALSPQSFLQDMLLSLLDDL